MSIVHLISEFIVCIVYAALQMNGVRFYLKHAEFYVAP